MKLYLISQTENVEYDTRDSAVVVAPDGEAAARLNPDGELWREDAPDEHWALGWASSPDKVSVRYLGEAGPELRKGEIICSSYVAG